MPTKRTKRTAVNDDDDYDGGEAVALLLKAIGEFMDCINCDKQFTVVSVVVLCYRVARNDSSSTKVKAESPNLLREFPKDRLYQTSSRQHRTSLL